MSSCFPEAVFANQSLPTLALWRMVNPLLPNKLFQPFTKRCAPALHSIAHKVIQACHGRVGCQEGGDTAAVQCLAQIFVHRIGPRNHIGLRHVRVECLPVQVRRRSAALCNMNRAGRG